MQCPQQHQIQIHFLLHGIIYIDIYIFEKKIEISILEKNVLYEGETPIQKKERVWGTLKGEKIKTSIPEERRGTLKVQKCLQK